MKSRHGKKYDQVFMTSYYWTRVVTMELKGDTKHRLSLLFAHDGVPPNMIMDENGEQTMWDFRCKCHNVDCHVKQVGSYSPLLNAAEGVIRELKRGTARKMVRSNLPRSCGMTALSWRRLYVLTLPIKYIIYKGRCPTQLWWEIQQVSLTSVSLNGISGSIAKIGPPPFQRTRKFLGNISDPVPMSDWP